MPQELSLLINSIFTFATENSFLLAILGLGILALIFIRRWPDIATFTFLLAGIRGGKHVEEYRRELAERTVLLGTRIREAAVEQRIRIQAMNLERERIQHLVRTNPILVKEVGKALQSVEREYLNSLREIKSEQAKEVLRLATEKRINDILQSLNMPANNTPKFRIDEYKKSSEPTRE